MVVLRGSIREPTTIVEALIPVAVLLLVLIVVATLYCCYRFRRNRRKKQATREMIAENARVGQRLTEAQADALFELNESWQTFAQLDPDGKSTKSKCSPATCRPKSSTTDGLSTAAMQRVDYFRLLRWSRRLRDALEESEEREEVRRVARRIMNEMESHAEMFRLDEADKNRLREIAELPEKSVTFISAPTPV